MLMEAESKAGHLSPVTQTTLPRMTEIVVTEISSGRVGEKGWGEGR